MYYMAKILLFDFSRVLLHPKDPDYSGSLNDLYHSLLAKESYDFFAYFALNTELLDFLRTIKTKFSLYILTSEIIQNAPEIRGILDEILDDVFSAKNLGLSKKDPQIYRLIAEKLQKNPNEITFIDDTIENIYPAKEAGLQTISYTSNKQLIKELQNL